MLLAKLKTPKIFVYHVNPIETLDIAATCISMNPIQYELGSSKVDFFVDFHILKQVPKYPSSLPLENQEMKEIPEIVKRFSVQLTNEELATWGENDETLLQLFANKYNLEIESFFTY